MICPGCQNASLKEDDNFCSKCGFNLKASEEAPSSQPDNKEAEDFPRKVGDSGVINDEKGASLGKILLSSRHIHFRQLFYSSEQFRNIFVGLLSVSHGFPIIHVSFNITVLIGGIFDLSYFN